MYRPLFVPSRLALAVALAIGSAMASVHAADGAASSRVRRVKFAAQPLSQALNAWATQNGVQLVVPQALVADKHAPVVSGTMTGKQALESLLAGSGLVATFDGNSVVLIRGVVPASGAFSAPRELATVKVTATMDRDIGAQSIPIERLQRNQAKDLADVFRDESSVVVGGGSRQAQRVYVRGIESSNLNVTVDGAKQGRNLFQHRGNIGGVEPDLLKKVEVQTAPSSDQGAGALGGSIRFETVDAQDFLDPEKSAGATVRASYGSVDNSKLGSTSVYGKLGEHAGLLAHIGANNFGDYKAGGGETVNGSAGHDRDYFVKFSLLDVAGHSLRASAERNRNSGLYRSGAGDGAYDPDADLTYQISQRDTYTLDHRYRQAGNDLVDWKFNLFRNETSLENLTSQSLTTSESFGGDMRNTARFGFGPSRHSLTTGVDYYNEDGTQKNAGVAKGGDNNARNLGAYVQERMTWGPALLSLGARYDDYSTEFGSTTISGNEISPSAGLELEIGAGFTGFLGYGESVRSTGIIPIQWLSTTTTAPTFNKQTGKDSYGKALLPETSERKELGVRYEKAHMFSVDDRFKTSVTFFDTYIENLIQQVGGSQGKPVTGFYNDDPVTSKGYEIRASWAKGGYQTSFNYTHADTVDNDGNAVAITRRMVGSTGDRFVWDNNWRVRNDVSLGYTVDVVRSLERDTIEREGYTLHNLQASWEPHEFKGLILLLTVRNLFDKRYTEQTSIGTDETAVYEPGRDVRLGMTYRF